jgi:hypothetical protein
MCNGHFYLDFGDETPVIRYDREILQAISGEFTNGRISPAKSFNFALSR